MQFSDMILDFKVNGISRVAGVQWRTSCVNTGVYAIEETFSELASCILLRILFSSPFFPPHPCCAVHFFWVDIKFQGEARACVASKEAQGSQPLTQNIRRHLETEARSQHNDGGEAT